MSYLKIVSFLLGIILLAPVAYAAPLKIVFFYPGGQGSQEQAQPLLDSFSEALGKASKGKIQTQITYISDPQEGPRFIQGEKPAGGILSLDVFLENGQPWGADVIAKSLQLPSGDGTNQYFILGKSGQQLPSGAIQVITSRPLDPNFVQKKLFPNLTGPITLQPTPNVVGKLRKIGKGEEQGLVLLDQFEWATIGKLKTPWAKNLESLTQSQKVPSAPFVIFRSNISPEEISQLQNALLKLSKDASVKETLHMLRIKGFQKATNRDLGA